MSYGYPDGCTQATHDRAFGESLGEEPGDDVVRLDCGHWGTEDAAYRIGDRLLCGECESEIQRQLTAGELMSRKDAATITRVFIRLEEQIIEAYREGRLQDARALAQLVGGVWYHCPFCHEPRSAKYGGMRRHMKACPSNPRNKKDGQAIPMYRGGC